MKPTITFFGGLNTIGGINIMIGCGDDAIVFDLGMQPTGYYTWGTSGAAATFMSQLRESLLIRKAPPVLNLFDEKYTHTLTQKDLDKLWGEYPKYKNVSAFVSHIHQDHMHFLPYVSSDTKVYMHKDAYSTYRGVVESGEYRDTEAQLMPLRDREEVKIGQDLSITITLYEVDHGTPGASAILVRVGDKKIVFTGDWKTHGKFPERMERNIADWREIGLDMLITEGTMLFDDNIMEGMPPIYEGDLVPAFKKICTETQGLVYLNLLCRDLDRVADFIKATKETGRKLVMDYMTAKLWTTAALQIGLTSLEGDLVLDDLETVVLYDERDMSEFPYQKVRLDEIVANKGDYVVFIPENKTPTMIEYEKLGEQGLSSSYFHADGNPLTNKDAILLQYIEKLGIDYHYYTTSGHSWPMELTRVVEAIEPKVVIPVHSYNASLLEVDKPQKLLPYHGQTIDLNEFFG